MHPLIRATLLAALVASPLVACQPTEQPRRDKSAKALLLELLAPESDHAALSKLLRPDAQHYKAVFADDVAGDAETFYNQVWNAGHVVIRPKAGQTDCIFWSATTEELKAGAGDAQSFPAGFRRVAEQGKLKPGVRWYRFKFVEKGGTAGVAYDGLVYLDGGFKLFPRPWKVVGK